MTAHKGFLFMPIGDVYQTWADMDSLIRDFISSHTQPVKWLYFSKFPIKANNLILV